jgi:hypothetical protein
MLGLRTVTTGGTPAGFVAIALAVAGLLGVVPGHSPALLAASAPSPLTLNINLASSQELSAISTGALVAEVNAIWWNSNLSLVWRTVDVSEPLPAMPDAEDWLRVLVLARQKPGAGETAALTVGELVRTDSTRPLAIASLTAARRIVDEWMRFQSLEGPHDYDRRIGVVLGRAVAHEIGHYLLGPAHARHGLMRANIDALEFADIRSRTFMLDQPARALLIRRAALASPSSYGSR